MSGTAVCFGEAVSMAEHACRDATVRSCDDGLLQSLANRVADDHAH